MGKFINKYWIELLGFLAVLLGVFLVFERVNLRHYARQYGGNLREGIFAWFEGISGLATETVNTLSPSDLLGWLLILFGTVFFIWRIRYHFAHSDRWDATICPRCGGNLHRVHRKGLDRLIGTIFFPSSARYACFTTGCGWTGLRHSRPHTIKALQANHTPVPKN